MNNFRQSAAVGASQSTSTTSKPKKTSRLTRFYEGLWAQFALLYRYGRKFLWVGSTCTTERLRSYDSDVLADVLRLLQRAPGGNQEIVGTRKQYPLTNEVMAP
jgi:hypothetical protein